MINAIEFLGFQHQGITHLTGNPALPGLADTDIPRDPDIARVWGPELNS
jgi:hypothetical protein